MSFAGSVSAMMSTLKNNRSLLSKRKHLKDAGNEAHYRIGKSLKYKELPTKELSNVKAKIRAKAIRSQRIHMFVVLFFVIVISVGVYSAINKVNNDYVEKHTPEWQEINQREKELAESTEKTLLLFLNKGYKLMAAENYSEAKYCFYKAKELARSDYRSALAYTKAFVYDCAFNGENCKRIGVLLKNMKNQFGNKPELTELFELYEESKNK